MVRAGEVYENLATGERVVIRVGTAESEWELLVVDLYVQPGGAVMGEHVHPNIEESFTVVHGRLDYRLDGRQGVAAGPGQRLHIPHGAMHDWWNAGEEEAQVLVEISPAVRFEEMILNAFGLVQDGKTDAKGRLSLLQAALLAQEFDDVIRFTKPPRAVQRVLYRALAPIARALGYEGSYAKYRNLPPLEIVEVEPWAGACRASEREPSPPQEARGGADRKTRMRERR